MSFYETAIQGVKARELQVRTAIWYLRNSPSEAVIGTIQFDIYADGSVLIDGIPNDPRPANEWLETLASALKDKEARWV